MPGELENISKKMRELVDGMKSSFQKASANISGHIGEVMSDEIKMTTETIKSVGASAKESSMKILKFFGTGWTLDLKSFAVDKKQLDVLKDIRKQGQEEKLSRLARFKKSKGGKFLAALLDFLGIPLAILAAGIGAIIGQILLPFKGIWKVAKALLTPFFKFFNWLSKGKLGGLVKAITKNKFFMWLGRLFSFFLKIPGLRVIAAGLKFGFTKLLFPLQILLSVFDFIEGFMAAEGDLIDKYKAGMENVVMKFIEWPAKMIGKLVDWLFDREEGTTEGEIISGVKWYIDKFFSLIGTIFEAIKVALKFVIDTLEEVSWEKTLEAINNIRTWMDELPDKITAWVSELWDKIKTWAKSKWPFGSELEDKPRTMPGPGAEDFWQRPEDAKALELGKAQLEEAKKSNVIQQKILDKEAYVPYPSPSAPENSIIDNDDIVNRETAIMNMTGEQLGQTF